MARSHRFVENLRKLTEISANRMEQAKGLDVATRIKNKERGGGAEIFSIDKNDKRFSQKFWAELNGGTEVENEAQLTEDSGDDTAYEQLCEQSYKLYKVENNHATRVEAKKLTVQLLETSSSYVLDAETELYVWIGKKSPESDRMAAMQTAKRFLAEHVRPQWCDGVLTVSRIVEGGEPILFREKFTNWPDTLLINVSNRESSKSNLMDSKKIEKFEVNRMFISKQIDEDLVSDNGISETQIWVVKGSGKEPLDSPKEFGHFYSGNCYIVQFKYAHRIGNLGELFKFIIFFWQGSDSSKNDRGSSGLLTTDLCKTISKNHEVDQVRVVQNKEPKQFKKLFEGKFWTHKGSRDAADEYRTALFEVREPQNTSIINATETSPTFAALHSQSCFILKTSKVATIWRGRGVSDASIANAKDFASTTLTTEIKVIKEGEESSDFISALGGKSEYANAEYLQKNDFKPRLFSCSEFTGTYEVDEVFSISQEDLVNTDVCILDVKYETFVWAGNQCTEYVKKMSMETALEYVNSANDGRPSKTNVWLVAPGCEPKTFSCHFPAWSDEKALKLKKRDTPPVLVKDALTVYSKNYTLEELIKSPPKELDQTKLETYLSDEDFLKAFEVTKEEFAKMPGWKQEEKKKSVGLY
eukprot:TRINITY_DN1350_c0_g1_i4.p1 TRINITY_DN1350_c0_g1~~TRINITY_DN1350_c0_g1_i4.p1  ORF type:complete len:642 (-),score=235.71 TRINITY_DN1350_c0_g1_i4:105-2030(-)